jgi:glycosyltransferase involved in cell wall biosynthesis
MKKVAIIYSGSRFIGGIDTYLENLFKTNEGAELILFSLGAWETSQNLKKEGKNVRFFSGVRFNPITIVRMANELKTGHYDLVVTGNVVSNAYGRFAALMARLPVVTIVHSDQKLDYQNPLIRFIYKVIDKITRWKTKRYIAVSEYLKTKLVDSGIKSGKIKVIYNGVSFRPKNKRDHKEFAVGAIGRLHQVKNFESLIVACSKLQDQNWILKIAGEGSERKNLEGLIDHYGLSGKVELVGHQKDIPAFLAGLDVYVQPSISEGFCLTVVEAMQAGVPVVVTPGGALPELVENGEVGVLLDGFGPTEIAAGIEKLANDKTYCEELTKKAQSSLDRFDMAHWRKETLKAFTEAAS